MIKMKAPTGKNKKAVPKLEATAKMHFGTGQKTGF
jgi:hypothetical protein